jgi:hypothetical protein
MLALSEAAASPSSSASVLPPSVEERLCRVSAGGAERAGLGEFPPAVLASGNSASLRTLKTCKGKQACEYVSS